MNYYIKNKSIKKEENKKNYRKNNSVIIGSQQQINDHQSFNSYKKKVRDNSEHNISFNHNSLMDKKDKNQYFLEEIQECINYFDGKKDKSNGCDNLINMNNANTANGSKQILDSQQTRDNYELIDEVRQLKQQNSQFRQQFIAQNMQLQEQNQINRYLQKELVRLKYQQEQTQQTVETQNMQINRLISQMQTMKEPQKVSKHRKNRSNVFINSGDTSNQVQKTIQKSNYLNRIFNNDDRVSTLQNNHQCLSYMDLQKSLFDK